MGMTWQPHDDELVTGVPTACPSCGEVVRVAERWQYDGELDAFGKAARGFASCACVGWWRLWCALRSCS